MFGYSFKENRFTHIPISSQIHFDTLMADDVSLILISIGRIIQKEVPQIM